MIILKKKGRESQKNRNIIKKKVGSKPKQTSMHSNWCTLKARIFFCKITFLTDTQRVANLYSYPTIVFSII